MSTSLFVKLVATRSHAPRGDPPEPEQKDVAQSITASGARAGSLRLEISSKLVQAVDDSWLEAERDGRQRRAWTCTTHASHRPMRNGS